MPDEKPAFLLKDLVPFLTGACFSPRFCDSLIIDTISSVKTRWSGWTYKLIGKRFTQRKLPKAVSSIAHTLKRPLSRYLIEMPMTRLGHRISDSTLASPRAIASSPAHS
jgi:hypothetical protein